MSRTVLSLALLLAPVPAIGQSVIVAPPDPLGDLARRQALTPGGSDDCEPGEGEEIVVCGRPGGGVSFRVPYRREPGRPPVRAMGELPRYGDLGSDDCHRLCYQPVMMNLDVGRLFSDPGGALRDMLRGR